MDEKIIELSYNSSERFLSSIDEKIIERKLIYDLFKFPSGDYYTINQLTNEIAKKNKIPIEELKNSQYYELINDKWSNYFKINLENYLKRYILDWTLGKLVFHKKGTPLIIKCNLFDDEGSVVVDFYKGIIHCFLGYANTYDNKNLSNATNNELRRVLITNIQKELFNLKKQSLILNYKNQKLFFDIFFYNGFTDNLGRVTDTKLFDEIIGIEDFIKNNSNIIVRKGSSFGDPHFEMTYDKTLFDRLPNQLKKYVYTEPKLQILHHDKIIKNKKKTYIHKISLGKKEILTCSYLDFKKWSYPNKFTNRDECISYINKNPNDLPLGIRANPSASYSHLPDFSWPDALGYKPGFTGWESDINVIRKQVLEKNCPNYKTYQKWYDEGIWPESFTKNLNGYPEYYGWIDFVGKRDFSVILKCKDRAEATKKHNATLQALYKTQNHDLIKKYTKHFVKKRKEYSEEILQNFFDSLPADVYPDNNSKKKCERKGLIYDKEYDGLYRAIFNRGKDKWYKKILEKWGEKVPMLFLNDDDKLEKIKREIKSCNDYTEWYNKYKSSHEDILIRLEKMYLLEILPKQKNHNRTKKSMEILLSNYKGKRLQLFREQRESDYQWILEHNLDEELFKNLKRDKPTRKKSKIS